MTTDDNSENAQSGLQRLHGMIADAAELAPLHRTLKMTVIEAERGRTRWRGTPDAAHLNVHGGVHGGWIAALLDSAMGTAVLSLMPPGGRYTTIEIKLNYLRPITADTEGIEAEGRVVNSGRTLAYCEGKVTDARGKLLAAGTATQMLFLPGNDGANA